MTDSSAKALPSVATSVIASVVMLGMAPLVSQNTSRRTRGSARSLPGRRSDVPLAEP